MNKQEIESGYFCFGKDHEMNKQDIEISQFNINAPKVKNIIGQKYGRLTVITNHPTVHG